MKDGLYKKSVFGLIAVAAFGVAVFLNSSPNQSTLNKNGLESANVSEINKNAGNPKTPGLEGAAEEARVLENSSSQSSDENIEKLLKNF